MKFKNTILSLLLILLLSSCDLLVNNNSSSDFLSSETHSSIENSSISSPTSSEDSSSASSSISSPSSSESLSSSENSSSNETSSNSSSSSSSIPQEIPWEQDRHLLDCGYYQMDLPKNYQSPINLKTTLEADSSSWSNNDLKDSLPYGFRYIYRNACDDGPKNHKTSADFYSSNNKAPGGLKIANTGVGFQSPMFNHTGEKLEIRIGLSQINNCNDKKEEGKDTFHIYFFNKEGEYLFKYVVEEKTISTSTKEIKFYWTQNAKDIAYFEFRCNAKPYKGSQCYNVGISYCNFKSWERA